MATLDTSGAEAVEKMLQNLGRQTKAITTAALYQGAGVAADALRDAVRRLPVEDFHPLPGAPNGKGFGPLNVLTPDDKEDLEASIGISKFEDLGNGRAASISFADGYSRHGKSKRFPKGVPLPVIARSIESGSSARKKNPFVRRSAKGAEERIIEAERKEIEDQIEAVAATGHTRPITENRPATKKRAKGVTHE